MGQIELIFPELCFRRVAEWKGETKDLAPQILIPFSWGCLLLAALQEGEDLLFLSIHYSVRYQQVSSKFFGLDLYVCFVCLPVCWCMCVLSDVLKIYMNRI